MSVLSIQSHVVFGHVGNAVAAFALQRLGIEVWPAMTVQLAHHTGHGPAKGGPLTLDNLEAVTQGLDDLGVLSKCQAVLSGYLGSAELGQAVLNAVALVKEANPDAFYVCDPVMGDDGELYVSPEIPRFFREEALPQADVLTPNLFELSLLTGWHIERRLDLLSASEWLLEGGLDCLLVTSVDLVDSPPDSIEMLVAGPKGIWRLVTPRLTLTHKAGGAGDLTAALFIGHLLQGRGMGEALALAGSSVHALLRAKAEDALDLPLVAAQEFLVKPPTLYEVEQVV
ncbi:pyridoxal kinase PdxY [Limibacillus sp. MBR-115]|jgi:pyridoxine kinase|uniref:pyridoxal kinase PdxY n=1 Tax=Limibacillus sp. MBR-115 TaxID=3156465 RepID=UPI00339752C6